MISRIECEIVLSSSSGSPLELRPAPRRRLPSSAFDVEDLSGYLTCLCQVENSIDNVFYGHDSSHWLQSLKKVLGIVLVHWCVHNAGSYGVEADPFFCILDCETPGHRIQASFRNHRNRAIVRRRSADRQATQ